MGLNKRIQEGGKWLGTTTSPPKGGWNINGGGIKGIKRGSEKGSANRRGRVNRPAEIRDGVRIR